MSSGPEVNRVLSDEEQGRLREIQTRTAAADPQFARRLDLAAAIRRRRRLYRGCWWLLALGVWMMLSGLDEARGLISLGTVAAGAGSALVVWSACTARGLRPPRPRRNPGHGRIR